MTNRDAYKLITALQALQVVPGTKLGHARNQTLKNAAAFIDAYNDRLEDLNIDFCSTDEKGNILRDQGGQYLFTKENQKALAREVRKFMDGELVLSFSVVSCADSKGLNEEQIRFFQDFGFVKRD